MKSAKRPKTRRHAITTVTQSRSAIFAPTLRPTAGSATVVVTTAWATATISRVQLTQIHRDILDVLFAHYPPHHRFDGSYAFLFSPHALMRYLGHSRGVNLEWLREKFDDLERAGLEVHTPRYTIRTSIVRKHGWTVDGTQYAVVLESEYVSFFAKDLQVHSEALTHAILRLRHAPTKALVRFAISHRSWHRSLDETLNEIGYVGGARSRRRAKAEIMTELEPLKRDFGLHIVAGSVRYQQHDRVWFEDHSALAADAS